MGGIKYEIPDEHNCSDDDSDIPKDYDDSSISAQAPREKLDTDYPNSLVEARVTLDKEKLQFKQKKKQGY